MLRRERAHLLEQGRQRLGGAGAGLPAIALIGRRATTASEAPTEPMRSTSAARESAVVVALTFRQL
jgi:hypothetical protein